MKCGVALTAMALAVLGGSSAMLRNRRRASAPRMRCPSRTSCLRDQVQHDVVRLVPVPGNVNTFMVRTLRPYHANLSKRQVKAPKVYIADSGLLHALLDIQSFTQLEGHPKVGASWEGFMLETVIDRLGARKEQCFFWATHAGAELDLLVVDGTRRRGFEFKRTTAPAITPSMRSALADLALDRLDVVHAGTASFPLAPKIHAIAASRLLEDL